jgi:hypothetical protein
MTLVTPVMSGRGHVMTLSCPGVSGRGHVMTLSCPGVSCRGHGMTRSCSGVSGRGHGMTLSCPGVSGRAPDLSSRCHGKAGAPPTLHGACYWILRLMGRECLVMAVSAPCPERPTPCHDRLAPILQRVTFGHCSLLSSFSRHIRIIRLPLDTQSIPLKSTSPYSR